MANTNPFTPNFGQIPKYIAGRDAIINEIKYAFEGGSGNPAQTSIFTGARGSGKTALLSYIANECAASGWVCVNTTCVKGVQEDILEQALKATEHLISVKKGAAVTGISVGQIISIDWERNKPDNANWRSSISHILDLLNEQGVGLLITIDEVDPGLDEMIQIAAIYQLLLRENRKVALLMAGLPSNISALLSDKSVSFLRRATHFVLENLSDYEVENAFRRTVETSGKTIEHKALEKAVESIGGFPYMLQLVGYRAWQEAEGKESINIKEVERGIEIAGKDFETRVLKASYDDLSAGDIEFLKYMLDDENESRVSDIEKRMKRSSGYVSRYRLRLIESGVIEPVRRGVVRFALPGFRDYLTKLYR